jgi:hypothetical protein
MFALGAKKILHWLKLILLFKVNVPLTKIFQFVKSELLGKAEVALALFPEARLPTSIVKV